MIGWLIDDRYSCEATIQAVDSSFWHTKAYVLVEKRDDLFLFHFVNIYDRECILSELRWNIHSAVFPWYSTSSQYSYGMLLS